MLIRKIELLLVGIKISLAILPGVPIGSPRNAKLEHRIFRAWLGGGIGTVHTIEAGSKRLRMGSAALYLNRVTSLLSIAVECASWRKPLPGCTRMT